jgi:transposase
VSQNLSGAVAVIGIDISKNSFHVVGLDARRAILLHQKWSSYGVIDNRSENLQHCQLGSRKSFFCPFE